MQLGVTLVEMYDIQFIHLITGLAAAQLYILCNLIHSYCHCPDAVTYNSSMLNTSTLLVN